MNTINIRKMGLAFGFTAALLYLGCTILMATVGHAASVKFFNTLFHGADVSSIIRMDVPVWEAAIGIAQTFIVFWLVGACVAGIYNFFNRSMQDAY